MTERTRHLAGKPSLSIRNRLIIFLLVGPGLVFAFAGLVMRDYVRTRLQTIFDKTIVERAEQFFTLTRRTGRGVVLEFADEYTPEFTSPNGPEYFELWRPDGMLVERSRSMGTETMGLPEGIDAVPELDNRLVRGRACRVLTVAFVPQWVDAAPDPLGAQKETAVDPRTHVSAAVILVLARDRMVLEELLDGTESTIVVGGLIFLVVLVHIGLVALAACMAPIERLRTRIKQLDPDQFEGGIQLKSCPEELRPILNQLNSLLWRLHDQLGRERRFISDVAHELRTPIAELKSAAEVVLTYQKGAGSASFFEDVRQIADEMELMVGNMLTLSRLETEAPHIHYQAAAPAAVVARLIARAAPKAEARAVTFATDIDPSAQMVTDTLMFEQIVQNLINNAVTYAPHGSSVTLTWAAPGVLHIANAAPDLEAADVEAMFQRFWRKDPARAGGGNAGLGLSLVQQLCAVLQISVGAALVDGRLTLTLTLPSEQRRQA